MGTVSDRLTQLLAPEIEGLGYECVGVEYLSGGRGASTLRVYIDKPEGITLEDCSAVSHQISGLLDVEDPIRENYNLEVSSPGLDRPLFTRQHYERFVGREATVRFHGKWNDRRKLTGRIEGCLEGDLLMESEGETFRVPFDVISTGRLVAEI